MPGLDQTDIDGSTLDPRWNFTPDLPLEWAPFYERPPNARSILRYTVGSWSPFRMRFWFFAIACGIWWLTSPSLEQTADFRVGWVLQIWVRNLVIFTVVAGGLHLWLYTLRRQGDDLRYDAGPYPVRRQTFLFGHQLWDNVFRSFDDRRCSVDRLRGRFHVGLRQWNRSAHQFRREPGVVRRPSPHHAVLGRVLLLRPAPPPPLATALSDRAHSPPPQHQSGPWSDLSQHPVEQIIDQSDCLIFLLIPAHPFHMIFMLMHHAIGAPTSHTGYHAVRLPGGRQFIFGAFFHQLHHRWFDCNYGTDDTPWDKVFGSFTTAPPKVIS